MLRGDTQTGRPERRSCAAMTDALAIDPPAADATLDAIEGVYRSRGAAFLRVATAITGDAAAAHDAVQEGFALAIRHRSRYRGDGPLEAWVWRLVVNAARSQRRRRTPVPTAEAGDHAGPAPADVTSCARSSRSCRSASGSRSSFATTRISTTRPSGLRSAFERERSARRSRRASGRCGAWPRRWSCERVRSQDHCAARPAGARHRGRPGGVGRRRQAVRDAPPVEADATPGARAGAGRRRARGGDRIGRRSRPRDALLPGSGPRGSTRHPAGVQADPQPEHHRRRSSRSRGSTRVRSAASPTSALPGGHTTSTSRRSPAPARCARSRSRGERRSLTSGATTRPRDAGTA